MRIVFAGTPDFAAKHLAALIAANNLDVVAVYTQPDRPAGRGKKLQPSAVKSLALAHNLPVEQPVNFKSEDAVATLTAYNADVMVVVAYGLLLPQVVLDTPRLGCINVHGSLLPRWRGAAPIQRAIWAGDTVTGVTIMQMDAGLDTGPMLSRVELPIQTDDTSASIYEKLATIGPEALVDALNKLSAGLLSPEAQSDSEATYAKKLSKEEATIDWQNEAAFIERCIRAFNPWPGTEFYAGEHRVKVWQARVLTADLVTESPAKAGIVLAANKDGIDIQCGEGVLRLLSLQPPGKKPMACQDLLNSRSHWFTVGQLIGANA